MYIVLVFVTVIQSVNTSTRHTRPPLGHYAPRMFGPPHLKILDPPL